MQGTQSTTNQSPTTYQGYTNYETWCVSLWLTNDEGLYNHMKDLVTAAEDKHEAAESIKEFIEEHNPVASDTTVYADLMNAALSEVDWLEVAEDFIDE